MAGEDIEVVQGPTMSHLRSLTPHGKEVLISLKNSVVTVSIPINQNADLIRQLVNCGLKIRLKTRGR